MPVEPDPAWPTQIVTTQVGDTTGVLVTPGTVGTER